MDDRDDMTRNELASPSNDDASSMDEDSQGSAAAAIPETQEEDRTATDARSEESVGPSDTLEDTQEPTGASVAHVEAQVTTLALRQRELQLEKAQEHVAHLQQSMSLLSATGAEMAALLNWRTNAYSALTDGLKRLLAAHAAGERPAGIIDAGSYIVLPSRGYADPSEGVQGEVVLREPAGQDVQYALPLDVTTILEQVESLARDSDAGGANRRALEKALAERDADIDELRAQIEDLHAEVDDRMAALAEGDRQLGEREALLAAVHGRIVDALGALASVLSSEEDRTGEVSAATAEADETADVPDWQHSVDEMDSLQAGVAAAVELMQGREVELQEQSGQLDSALGELAAARAASDDAMTELESRRRELAEAREAIPELLVQLAEISPESAMPSVAEEDAPDQAASALQIEQLRTAISSAVQAFGANASALEAAHQDNASLTNRLAGLEDRASAHEAEMRQIEAMSADLRSMLSSTLSEDELAALQASTAGEGDRGASSRIAVLGAIIGAAMSAVRKRDKALSVAGNERAAVEEQLTSLQNDLQQRDADNAGLGEQIETLQTEARSLQEAKKVSGEELALVDERIGALRSELLEALPDDADVDTDAGAQAGEVPAADHGVGALEATVRSALDQLRAHEQTISEANEAQAAAAERIESLQADYDLQSAALDNLRAQLDGTDSELAGLQGSIGGVESDLSAALAEQGVTLEPGEEGGVAALAAGVTALVAVLRDKQQAIQDFEINVKELEERSGELDGQTQTLQAHLDEAVEANAGATAQIGELQSVIDGLNSRSDELDADVAKLNDQVAALKDQLSSVETEKSELAAKLSETEKEYAASNAEHETALAEKAAQIEELSRAAEESAAGMAEKDEAIRSAETQIAALEAERSALQESMQQTEAALNERTAEADAVKAQLAAYEADLASTAEERDALLETSPVRMVNVPGTWQGPAELDCDAWDPNCSETRLRKRRDGTYRKTFAVPSGSYQVKVAINGSWDENYGAGGVPDGDPIEFEVGESGSVTFAYDPVSHILTVV